MGRVIHLNTTPQCTGTCETLMTGCDCHPTSATSRYPAAPAAPDQPLITQSGDLGEHHEKPEGVCWTCAAVCLIAFGLAAGMLWFAVRQIIKGTP